MRYAKACIAMIVLASSAPAMAQSPLLPIQGTLRELAGNLINDSRDVTFKLYGQGTGGGEAFYTVQRNVRFTDGQFVVYLGDPDEGDEELNPADFEGLPKVWLGIAVSPDGEMTPRVQLGTSPFAMYAQRYGAAQTAEQAESATTAATATIASAANDLNCSGCVGQAQLDAATNNRIDAAADDVNCSGCVGLSDLDSTTTARIDAPAGDVNCSGCVQSDEISYVIYRGPNSASSRAETISLVEDCGPLIAAKFCAVAFVGISGMTNDSDELQCFVTRP